MEAKIVSSLVKCFSDSNVSDFPELTRISVLKNERLSFQLVYKDDQRRAGERERQLSARG